MLHEFLTIHRDELIARCRDKVSQRLGTDEGESELNYGITYFLEQLITTLTVEETAQPLLSLRVSGPSGGGAPGFSEIGAAASKHGGELLRHGFTIDQVVHDYGDLCQAVTELAEEREVPLETEEFRTLNRCLDNAIANAVTEFNYLRDLNVAARQAHEVNERLGVLAHELRNHLNSAVLALTAIKSGGVGLHGATADVLDRSLVGLRGLIDRSLADVRMTAGLAIPHEIFSLADFITEVRQTAKLEAKLHGCGFTVAPVEAQLALDADRDLIYSAISNLLQNAFKFTKHGSEVRLSAYASADQIRLEVEDRCGGLAPGNHEKIFEPFVLGTTGRTGLGLGLSLSRRSVELFGGTLTVENLPGTGCIFTIVLPRFALPEPRAVFEQAPVQAG